MDDILKQILGTEVPAFLQNAGYNLNDATTQFNAFYQEIYPDIEAQMAAAAAGDTLAEDNLKILRDRLIVKAGSISLDIISKERAAVVSIILGVLQTAIKLA